MTQPFHFPNGQLAYNADDLLELCQQFPDDGTNYLLREDLEKWLVYIGKDDIAQFAASARQTPIEDRQKLEEFLNKCHALSSPEIKSPAVQKEEKTTVVETKQEPELVGKPSVAQEPEVVKVPQTKVQESSISSTPKESKPSFFQLIARLIANVLYRNKN